MVLCQVRTGVLLTVKAKAPNEHVYQLSYADGQQTSKIQVPDLKCNIKFTTPPSYIGIVMILMYCTTFLSEVCNVCVLAWIICDTITQKTKLKVAANPMLSQASAKPLASIL